MKTLKELLDNWVESLPEDIKKKLKATEQKDKVDYGKRRNTGNTKKTTK